MFSFALGGATNAVVAPVVMGSVALAGDYVMRIEMPKFELPKVPKLEVPKLELPKLELPKIGGGSKKEAIFIDDNPNAAPKAAAPKAANVEAPAGSVRVRAATAPKKAFSVADKEAPTLAELQKSKGIQVTISDGQYKQFPVRRLPGKNMEQFLDMSADYWKTRK